mmetsp:Transcript_143273/g.458084  ORF Transcript_143273/g.458084 Transcript_143273/m.458084 type:complete len:252 (+) Transcript_143273:301-1056(+)
MTTISANLKLSAASGPAEGSPVKLPLLTLPALLTRRTFNCSVGTASHSVNTLSKASAIETLSSHLAGCLYCCASMNLGLSPTGQPYNVKLWRVEVSCSLSAKFACTKMGVKSLSSTAMGRTMVDSSSLLLKVTSAGNFSSAVVVEGVLGGGLASSRNLRPPPAQSPQGSEAQRTMLHEMRTSSWPANLNERTDKRTMWLAGGACVRASRRPVGQDDSTIIWACGSSAAAVGATVQLWTPRMSLGFDELIST